LPIKNFVIMQLKFFILIFVSLAVTFAGKIINIIFYKFYYYDLFF